MRRGRLANLFRTRVTAWAALLAWMFCICSLLSACYKLQDQVVTDSITS